MACEYLCNSDKKIFMASMGRFVPCPACSDFNVIVARLKEEGRSLYDLLRIPPQYTDLKPTDEELIESEMAGYPKDASVNNLISFMKAVNEAIYNETVYRATVYFHAPVRFDLRPFVFGAMALAIEKGLGVVPMISCNSLYGLQKVGDFPFTTIREINHQPNITDLSPEHINAIEGYRLTQATGLSYYDYINADLCFIEATAHTSNNGAKALADLITERARNGLPTYVMGYWSLLQSNSVSSIRFLMSNSVKKRLDLLFPIEMTSKSKGTNGSSPLILDEVRVRSKVEAGLSNKNLLQ